MSKSTPILVDADIDNWHKLDYHELCTMFPPMSDAEYDALTANMKAQGYLRSDPIILVDMSSEEHGRVEMILDGRNRHMAAMDANVVPNFMLYTGDDPVGFVTSRNMDRRHLTTGQRASVASKLATYRVGDNQFSGGVTRKEAAAQLETTETAIKRYRAVEAADPALAAAIDSGAMTLNAAYSQVKGQAEVAKEKPKETNVVPLKEGADEPKPPETSSKGNRPDPDEKMGSTNMEFDGNKDKGVFEVWWEPSTGKVMFQLGTAKNAIGLRPDTAEAIFDKLERVLNAIGTQEESD